MRFSRSVLLICSLFFGVGVNSFAQSAACEKAISNKYSGEYQDKYGNGSSRKISMLQYYAMRPKDLAHINLATITPYCIWLLLINLKTAKYGAEIR
jgi:hypothetical protein